jgi:probable DNA metabolism protein
MPGSKDLAFPADVIFVYDGSLEGFLCCVHESVYTKQIPFAIFNEDEAQPSLLENIYIETDLTKAQKVRHSIIGRLTPRAMDLVETVFLSCLEQREIAILNFLLFAYRTGPKTAEMLGHPVVAKLLTAEKHLFGECHLLLGFVRFSDYGGKLASVITPKNFVLPFIARHFISRFSQEDFLIYDKTHKVALVYQNRKAQLLAVDSLEISAADETEQTYRELWKQFYNTIAIKERFNPKCRMTHIPKRYWENMVEMKDLL